MVGYTGVTATQVQFFTIFHGEQTNIGPKISLSQSYKCTKPVTYRNDTAMTKNETENTTKKTNLKLLVSLFLNVINSQNINSNFFRVRESQNNSCKSSSPQGFYFA